MWIESPTNTIAPYLNIRMRLMIVLPNHDVWCIHSAVVRIKYVIRCAINNMRWTRKNDTKYHFDLIIVKKVESHFNSNYCIHITVFLSNNAYPEFRSHATFDLVSFWFTFNTESTLNKYILSLPKKKLKDRIILSINYTIQTNFQSRARLKRSTPT